MILNRHHLAAIPEGAVYVGRGTPLGNPFVIGRAGTREECVELYREWYHAPAQSALREAARAQLRGRDLVCWCAPALCHASVIDEDVNA